MKRNLSLEKYAAEFRAKLGYDAYNPIRIKSLLIQLKILTVYYKMNCNFSGMSLKINDNRFMLINSDHSIGRQHFTICHELYHLFIQDNFERVICEAEDNNDRVEINADIFAANLLLPREGLIKMIPADELNKNKIKISTILKIEQFFACSHSALLNRLSEFDIIGPDYKAELLPDISEKAMQYGFDTKLYQPGNEGLVIGDFGLKVKEIYDKDYIGESHYYELMRSIGFDLEELELQYEKAKPK